MVLPVRRKLPHMIPQWVPDGSWFFITINCVPPGRNQLSRADTGEGVLAAIAYNHDKLVWHCRLALLMPDHLHAILAFPAMPGLKTTLTHWKKFVAREHLVKWQRDFFDHRLRNDQELLEKTSYILMNPVRKGLCKRPEDWPWVYRPKTRLPPQLK
jgi:putative transposase